MKHILLVFILSVMVVALAGITPASSTEASSGDTWAKTYGGPGDEEAYAVKRIPGRGYIVAGFTTSFGNGARDMWVLRLDNNGTVLWQKTYGGKKDDSARAIIFTGDGGFIVAGSTASFGAGQQDMWVLKLDEHGLVCWQHTYGGAEDDEACSLALTADGGCMLAGQTTSCGAGASDIVVMKIDTNGCVEWQKTYGCKGNDGLEAMAAGGDNSFLLTGQTMIAESVKPAALVMKLDSRGNILWQKTCGQNEGSSIVCPAEEEYFIIGNGELQFDSQENQGWVAKVDNQGRLGWKKIYGQDIRYDNFLSSVDTGTGYIIIGGSAYVSKRFISHLWLIKIDRKGHILWQRTYGSLPWSRAHSLAIAGDGGYVAAGFNGDRGESGMYIVPARTDMWILKTDCQGKINFRDTSEVITLKTATRPRLSNEKAQVSLLKAGKGRLASSKTGVKGEDSKAVVKTQAPQNEWGTGEQCLYDLWEVTNPHGVDGRLTPEFPLYFNSCDALWPQMNISRWPVIRTFAKGTVLFTNGGPAGIYGAYDECENLWLKVNIGVLPEQGTTLAGNNYEDLICFVRASKKNLRPLGRMAPGEPCPAALTFSIAKIHHQRGWADFSINSRDTCKRLKNGSFVLILSEDKRGFTCRDFIGETGFMARSNLVVVRKDVAASASVISDKLRLYKTPLKRELIGELNKGDIVAILTPKKAEAPAHKERDTIGPVLKIFTQDGKEGYVDPGKLKWIPL